MASIYEKDIPPVSNVSNIKYKVIYYKMFSIYEHRRKESLWKVCIMDMKFITF